VEKAMRRRVVPFALAVGAVLGGAGAFAERSTRIADRIRGQAIAAAHPPMEAPTVVPAAAARHMRDDDVVVGVVVDGAARAYPWWVVKNFHAVNDTLGGVPVALTFCEQCTGAAAFRRGRGDRVLTLEVVGVYNGTIIPRDRETGTLWSPFGGQGLEGPLAGERLERIPVVLTRWADWRRRHPATDVVWGPAQVRGGHGSWYEPGKWGIVGEMGATIAGWDTRLPENVLVYGLDVPGGRRSYPLTEVKSRGAVNDTVAGVPVVVLARGEFEAAAFARTVDARTLTFRAAVSPDAMMEDAETGSAWSAEGVAVRGPLQGRRLTRVDGYVVEWHVWAAYNPDTDVYGAARAGGPEVAGDVPFPDLVLSPVDGGPPQPVRLGGDVTLVALWAAWCAPCREEMPLLERLARRHGAAGLSVVGIAVHMPDDESERRAVRDFLAQARITFPNRLVDDPAYGRLEELLSHAGRPGLVLPTVLVVDKGRRLRAVFRGREVAGLAAALPAYLAPLATSAP
jgi:thiol-disulfide isomerase/thioredoxin